MIDEVAERARTVGGHALGSLHEMLDNKTLKEDTTRGTGAQHIVRSLLTDHEHIIKKLRKDLKTCDEKYNDMGTSDYLTGLMETHEKMAWMLRSHLE